MKTSTLLILGAAGYAVWHFGNLAVAGDTLQVVFKNVTLKGASDFGIVLTVQNISNATINLNSMTGTVTVNDNQLGTISDFQAVSIPPNSQMDINVDLQLGLFGLIPIVKQILAGGGNSYNFEVKGNANANGLIVPLDVQNDFTF